MRELVASLLALTVFAAATVGGVCSCCELDGDGAVLCEYALDGDNPSIGNPPCCEESSPPRTIATTGVDATPHAIASPPAASFPELDRWASAPRPAQSVADPRPPPVPTYRMTSRLLL